jgi:hypothetical protein
MNTRAPLIVFAVYLGIVSSALADSVQEEVTGDKGARLEVAQKPLSPRIVTTTPRPGAMGVDPSLAEITVTFDRDMGPGMSWTGGPPLFPRTDDGRKARWIDARTCGMHAICWREVSRDF